MRRVVLFIISALFLLDPVCAEQFYSFYCKSLHYTGAGMKYWYEKGFMKVTNIAYERLGCSQCHVKSCDICHMIQKEEGCFFSLSKAKDQKTCLTCHGRERMTEEFDKKMNTLGIHHDMKCMDCHSGKDVHGTGKEYIARRDAVKTDCLFCHTGKGAAPVFEKKLRAHRIHKGKVDCLACHVSSSMVCYNCHFESFLKTRTEEGNFIPVKSWLLLINFKGKVTAGTVMTIVYKGKRFIAYAPFFTHSVRKGRSCRECHANKAMRLIKEGKKIPVVSYKDGRIISWKGVVPCVLENIKWTYFDKKEGRWIPLKEGKEVVQFTNYGEPLTERQIRMLMKPFGGKR